MTEPTPEEIERVAAWHKAQQVARLTESQRKREEIQDTTRRELEAQLSGRQIVSVEGEQDYANWRTLILRFDDGSRLEIDIDRWADPVELGVEVVEPEAADPPR